MKKQYHLTREGIDELKDELAKLIALRGPIAERIKNAREFGDLTENAEYGSARQEQERVESRISEIENILKNAELIKKPRADKKVHLGSVVTLKGAGRTSHYTIVGTVEANPLEGKISDESPVGRALIGKMAGDKITVNMPLESVSYAITDIA